MQRIGINRVLQMDMRSCSIIVLIYVPCILWLMRNWPIGQLRDQLLQPGYNLVQNKAKGEKPSMEEIQCAS